MSKPITSELLERIAAGERIEPPPQVTYSDLAQAVLDARSANVDLLEIIRAQPLYDAIRRERGLQDRQWGGPDHDDGHGVHTWIALITKQLGKAAEAYPLAIPRAAFIRVAALCVAAIEKIDRAEGAR